MHRSGPKWWEVGNRCSPSDANPGPSGPDRGDQGAPDGCSPASTGTRWTTRDGSPSPPSSAPSSALARSCRAGSMPAWPSTPGAGWDALAAKVAALPITDQSAAPLPALRSSRARRRSSSIGRGGSCCRPTCASTSTSAREAVVVGSRDHAEIWAPQARGRRTPRGSRTPTSWPEAFQGLGDLARTTCASRVRSGSDRRMVEDRWR